MLIRIVHDGSIDKRSPIKPLLGIGMKTHTQGCSAQKRKNGADPRKELTIYDRVKLDAMKLSENLKTIQNKSLYGCIVNAHDVFIGDDIQYL